MHARFVTAIGRSIRPVRDHGEDGAKHESGAHVVERVGRMLREVNAIFTNCQVVGGSGEVQPVIVERGLAFPIASKLARQWGHNKYRTLPPVFLLVTSM